MVDAFHQCHGLTAAEFESLIAYLRATCPRISAQDHYGVNGPAKLEGKWGMTGSRHEGEIMGVKIVYENVKDGELGYYWVIRLVTETWNIEGLMSMSPPRGPHWEDSPYTKITIPSFNGPNDRYIFRIRLAGDVEQYRHDMTLIRLFDPQLVE